MDWLTARLGTIGIKGVALTFMAAAIIASGFAPVAPGGIAGWLKAAAGVCTGLAALFMHPPGSGESAPPGTK